MTRESTLTPRKKALFAAHRTDVEAFFCAVRPRVYSWGGLEEAIRQNRAAWHLTTVSVSDLVDLLVLDSRLRLIELNSASYSPIQRYTWDAWSPFELGLSLKPNSYLSHATAAYLCGLLPEDSPTIYVNKEQSPKDQLGTLTQEALDRAFSSRPRRSKLVYADQAGHQYVVVSGKATNLLGVGPIKGPAGERLYATRVERTLIDIAVRPIYCDGVAKVLDAYRAARGRVSVKRLMTMLKKLGHLYPYHQAIGFYLERAGFDGEALDLARRPGLDFDFYLTHGMTDTVYDKAWRLHRPRGL